MTEQPIETNACEFSTKADYLVLGRICQIDKCSCSNWNKPLIFVLCPVRSRQQLKEPQEKELLEQ